jgi:hypothetical protein
LAAGLLVEADNEHRRIALAGLTPNRSAASRRESLLRQSSWPKVRLVLEAIDRIEAIGIDPVDVAPDHWRHLHNRMLSGQAARPYTRDRHHA